MFFPLSNFFSKIFPPVRFQTSFLLKFNRGQIATCKQCYFSLQLFRLSCYDYHSDALFKVEIRRMEQAIKTAEKALEELHKEQQRKNKSV